MRLDTHRNAERAIEKLNGTRFSGYRERLNVKFANPNGSGPHVIPTGVFIPSYDSFAAPIPPSDDATAASKEESAKPKVFVSSANKKRPFDADESGNSSSYDCKQKCSKVFHVNFFNTCHIVSESGVLASDSSNVQRCRVHESELYLRIPVRLSYLFDSALTFPSGQFVPNATGYN